MSSLLEAAADLLIGVLDALEVRRHRRRNPYDCTGLVELAQGRRRGFGERRR